MKNEVSIFLILLVLFKSSLLLPTPYTNPVINEDAPEPSLIKEGDYYYLFSTGEKIFKSKDLINWKFVKKAFEGKRRPVFVDTKIYWAPCITKQENLFILYFSLAKWRKPETGAIGVATSKSPEGPFKLVGDGKLFTSEEVGVLNSIDPFYIEDDGKKYLIWGSFHGIYGIELTKDGTQVKNIHNKFQIAGSKFEGAYIYKRDKYYYLFASVGNCYHGDSSTCQIVVGRAKDLKGPYMTKNQEPMLDNKYEFILVGNQKFVGPGHNSRIIEDKIGKTWMLYHAYIRGNPRRIVCIDEVKWTRNNWPTFEGAFPSTTKRVGPYL